MSNYVNRADAVVALKSFGRRYSELVSGPADDDAWDRLVRTPGTAGKSAVDYTSQAIDDLSAFTSLAALVAKVPDKTKSGPLPQAERTTNNAQSIAELQAKVQAVASSAALALDARRDEDYEHEVVVNGTTTSLSRLTNDLVTTLAANLRLGDAAIEGAR
jgi:hypothetical protein